MNIGSYDISNSLSNVRAEQALQKTNKVQKSFQQYLDPKTGETKQLSEAERNKIKETAKEFEAMFLTNMLEQMYQGVELEKPFGGGNSENIYRSMLIGKYAENMSENGGVGVAEQIENSMTKMQLGI